MRSSSWATRRPALHYLQRALQLDPQNEDYLLDIGEFLGHHRAHDEAVRVFEVAAKRMPQSPRVTFGLAVSYILQNRSDEAQRLLEGLIAAHPRFEPAYKALGECYEGSKNAKGLVDLGKALQQINPQNPLGWYLEGAGYLQEGRIESSPLDIAVTCAAPSAAFGSFKRARAFSAGQSAAGDWRRGPRYCGVEANVSDGPGS